MPYYYRERAKNPHLKAPKGMELTLIPNLFLE
jgi:hypothetical protein